MDPYPTLFLYYPLLVKKAVAVYSYQPYIQGSHSPRKPGNNNKLFYKCDFLEMLRENIMDIHWS